MTTLAVVPSLQRLAGAELNLARIAAELNWSLVDVGTGRGTFPSQFLGAVLRGKRDARRRGAVGCVVSTLPVADAYGTTQIGNHIVSFETDFAQHSRKLPPTRRAIYMALSRYGLVRAGHVVAPSEGMAERAVRLGVPIAKVSVVPNVVDLKKVTVSSPEVAPDLISLAFVGRMVDFKRPTMACDVAARVRSITGRKVLLTMVGDGPLQRHVRDLVPFMNAAGVELQLRGWQADPFACVPRGSVLLSTSRFEPFGNVMIEAVHRGCRVAATRTDGSIDIAARLPASVFTSCSIELEDLVSTTIATLDNGGSTARSIVEKFYSPAAVAARWNELVADRVR